MPRTAPFRTNITCPKPLYRDLHKALKRRQVLDAAAGKESSTTVSAWFREKARETIAAYK